MCTPFLMGPQRWSSQAGRQSPQSLIRLPSSDNKFACEIFFTDLSSFFNPAFKPNILDPAEIVDFHVMRVSSSIVSRWGEKSAREIIAVTAQLHALVFHTI